MRAAKITILFALLILLGACSKKISISANPGEFNVRTIGKASTKNSISASMKLTKFTPSTGWPPAAYIGFYQGANRSNSIQVLIIRNHPNDNYLVAGYRVINDGKQVLVKSIENIPIDSSVHVILKFVDGDVTLKIDNHESLHVKTTLSKVSPYVSVSSGSADYVVSP